jgi:hypothetical protein
MSTRELINNSALMRFRLGVVLIWLGVLTWMPFIVLRITGEKPSLFMFLPFHLIGVIGGSRVRSLARRELGLAAPKKDVWRSIGHAMIFFGILVWLPYFYMKLVVHQSVDVMNFLPFHLTGIFGGIGLLFLSYWINRRER